MGRMNEMLDGIPPETSGTDPDDDGKRDHGGIRSVLEVAALASESLVSISP